MKGGMAFSIRFLVCFSRPLSIPLTWLRLFFCYPWSFFSFHQAWTGKERWKESAVPSVSSLAPFAASALVPSSDNRLQRTPDMAYSWSRPGPTLSRPQEPSGSTTLRSVLRTTS